MKQLVIFGCVSPLFERYIIDPLLAVELPYKETALIKNEEFSTI